MGCYFQGAGYATYVDGKFLTTWPKTTLPPCFDHSTVMWGGYNNVQRDRRRSEAEYGLQHDVLGNQGRAYITRRSRRQTVPALRDPSGAALGRRHDRWHHHQRACQTRSTPTPPSAPAPVSRSPTAPTSLPTCARELHDRPGAGHVPEPAARDHDGRRRVRCHHAAAARPRRPCQHPRDLLLRQRIHVGRARAHREVRAVRAVACGSRCGSAGPALPGRAQHDAHRVLPRPAADDDRGCRARAAGRRPAIRRRVALGPSTSTTVYGEY